LSDFLNGNMVRDRSQFVVILKVCLLSIVSRIKVPIVSSSWLMLISSIYIVSINNSLFWSKFYPLTSGNLADKLFVCFSFAAFFVFVLYVLMSLFSVKGSTRYVVSFLIILSSVISYFMNDYGTVISYSMVQNLVQTDVGEAFDLISVNLLLHVFIFGIVPCVFIWLIKLKPQSITDEFKNRAGVLFVLFVVTSSTVYFSIKDIAFIGRENRELRYYINPVFPIMSVYKYVKYLNKDKNNKLEEVYSDASLVTRLTDNGKKTVLVFVVGETARSVSFNLNGYEKNTTPLLNKLSIISFSNTYSCGTATAESLPCMFSDVEHDNFNIKKIRHRENLLDALKYAGVDVLWRENDSGCKGVCNRSETEVMHVTAKSSLCHGDECYDEVLLQGLSERIKNIKNDTVIFLHQQGSHGPAYYKRTPEKFRKFQPECTSKALQECSNQEITNSYDNTILYTDYFLAKVIDVLKSESETVNTAMIYMSDHGESLGESGLYLHGLPYFMAPDEQIKIPFIMWLSPDIQETKSISEACLASNSHNAYSHDNLVHSVMGLMDVKSKVYNKQLDVFSDCRRNDKISVAGSAEEIKINKKS